MTFHRGIARYGALAVLLLLDVSSARVEEAAPAYLSLAGTWKGSYAVLQRGRCTIGRAARVDAQVSVVLAVDEDGAFNAKVTSIRYMRNPAHLDAYGQFPEEGDPGRGQFNPDLTFILKAPRRFRCTGGMRETELAYSGQVTQKKGRTMLNMKAPVEPCPDLDKCIFENVLELVRQ